jgi:hypothetical protein
MTANITNDKTTLAVVSQRKNRFNDAITFSTVVGISFVDTVIYFLLISIPARGGGLRIYIIGGKWFQIKSKEMLWCFILYAFLLTSCNLLQQVHFPILNNL